MKKIIISILSLIVGIVLGFFISCLYLSIENIETDKIISINILEAIYYISNPIGVIITFLAVIVALFGNEIKNKIYRPKCSVSLIENSFTEFLGDSENSSTPVSQYYDCCLLVKNIGNKEIKDLEFVIKDVSYAMSNQKLKKVSKFENSIYWSRPDLKTINLRENESKKISIARIYPENEDGTPDLSRKTPPKLSIMGHNPYKKHEQNGKWSISYCLQTPESIVSNFDIEITWSGKWCSRLTEMKDELTVKINRK